MDIANLDNSKSGCLVKTDEVSTWDGIKLHLQRDYPNDSPKAVMIILHGLANHLGLYDNPDG